VHRDRSTAAVDRFVLGRSASAAFTEAQFPDKFFDSYGVQIHYVEAAAGEPMVLLHGVGGSLGTFVTAGVVSDLKKFPQAIRLVVVYGAMHAGETGIVRRPELLMHIREFISAQRGGWDTVSSLPRSCPRRPGNF
jgi:hypothetical protein